MYCLQGGSSHKVVVEKARAEAMKVKMESVTPVSPSLITSVMASLFGITKASHEAKMEIG